MPVIAKPKSLRGLNPPSLTGGTEMVPPAPITMQEVPSVLPIREPTPDELYAGWQKTQAPADLAKLLDSYNRLISHEVQKYKGTLSDQLLRAHAKKFAVGAIKSFDPSKGAVLSTHIVNTLKQLHRVNYSEMQAARLSEELQRGVGPFIKAKQQLLDDLGREPTATEIADYLSWPISKIDRMERQVRGEVAESSLVYEPEIYGGDVADEKMAYVYHDLSPQDKLIMEWSTGYGGKPIMSKKDIAKKLKISPAAVTQRSATIAKRIKEVAGI